MHENEISEIILDVAFNIHRELGPGLFESVYESVFVHELKDVYGFEVERQSPIPLIWNGINMGIAFKADLIIEKKVIVELKSVETVMDIHRKQLLTYLKITDLKLGLLINFNEALLKHGIKRIVNNL
jgi:GxxExxY protein